MAALDKPVTYTETKIPLGELVQKVAADTGVSLAAAPEVADEPVAVVVKEMPARELLEQLADLLDYRWARRGHVPQAGTLPSARGGAERFEIWRDLAGKQREEALRQAVFAELEKRWRLEADQYIRMAALSPTQIQRLLDEEKQRRQQLYRLTPDQQRALLNNPDQCRRPAASPRSSPASAGRRGMAVEWVQHDPDGNRKENSTVTTGTPRFDSYSPVWTSKSDR